MAKGKKAKLPKKIGGLKLPKELRKAGGKLAKVAASPAGRELIAAGLGLAAAAATAAVEKDRARRRAAAGLGDAKPAASAPPKAANNGGDPHDIGVALGKMAEAALAGLFKPKAG